MFSLFFYKAWLTFLFAFCVAWEHSYGVQVHLVAGVRSCFAILYLLAQALSLLLLWCTCDGLAGLERTEYPEDGFAVL